MNEDQQQQDRTECATINPDDVPVSYAGIILGTLIMVVGGVLFLYCIFCFNTTISSGEETVNNIGLVGNRVVGVVAGGVIFLFGLLLDIAQTVVNTIKIHAGKN